MTTPPEFDKQGGDEPAPNAWETLGVPEPPFLDDRLGPQVDRDFLRRFVRGELPESAEGAACQLILLFRAWSRAHKEVRAEEAAKRKSQ